MTPFQTLAWIALVIFTGWACFNAGRIVEREMR